MSTISLRRTKDKGLIGLQPKTIEKYYVELSLEERKLYDELEGKAKGVVQDYINAGSLMRNYSTVLSILLRLRQICTNLALCPSDVRSIIPSNTIEGIGKSIYFLLFLKFWPYLNSSNFIHTDILLFILLRTF